MTNLTREELLTPQDRRIEPVTVKWDGKNRTVHVRSLMVSEAIALNAKIAAVAEDDGEQRTALQLVAFVCDESGAELFQSVRDATVFMRQSSASGGLRLLRTGNRLNSIDEEAVEVAEGNS